MRGAETGRRHRAVIVGVASLATIGSIVALSRSGGNDAAGSDTETTAVAAATSTSSSTTAPATTTATPPIVEPTTSTTRFVPRQATVSFSGDMLIHRRVWRMAATNADASGRTIDGVQGYDFRPMFAEVADHVAAADWSICHLEVPLAADNQGLSSYPAFTAPGALAADLADLGFDSCSTASNHTLDNGIDGVWETLDVLDAAGLGFSGSARSADERASSIWLDVGGIHIAHLAFTYWFNGYTLPDDAQWAANQIDEATILADAARARAEGAEIVIVSLHWGDQYVATPNAQQTELGPTLLASDDIDLIVGHHVHVVQPIDRIDDEWLVYGVGNLLSNQAQRLRRDALIVTAEFTEGTDGSFAVTDLAVLPVFVDNATLTILPAGPSTRPAGLQPWLGAELDASWNRVVSVLEAGSGFDDLTLVGG